MSETEWIIIDGPECVCRRCGARDRVQLPMGSDEFVGLLYAFIDRYRGCPAVESRSTLEILMAAAEVR